MSNGSSPLALRAPIEFFIVFFHIWILGFISIKRDYLLVLTSDVL